MNSVGSIWRQYEPLPDSDDDGSDSDPEEDDPAAEDEEDEEYEQNGGKRRSLGEGDRVAGKRRRVDREVMQSSTLPCYEILMHSQSGHGE